MQKGTKQRVKGHLLHAVWCPFTTQFEPFCNASRNSLSINKLCRSVKKMPPSCKKYEKLQ